LAAHTESINTASGAIGGLETRVNTLETKIKNLEKLINQEL
jgi:hypothetical protein